MIRALIARLRQPGSTPDMRARRRYLAALRAQEPAMMARPVIRRVDVMCRCTHTYSQHVVVSAAQAVCTEACPCVIFRGERVVVQ